MFRVTYKLLDFFASEVKFKGQNPKALYEENSDLDICDGSTGFENLTISFKLERLSLNSEVKGHLKFHE